MSELDRETIKTALERDYGKWGHERFMNEISITVGLLRKQVETLKLKVDILKDQVKSLQAEKSDEEHVNDVDDYTSQWGSAGPDCCTV